MTCSNCNHEIMPGAQFCSRCGTRIGYQQTAETLPPAPMYSSMIYNRVARHIQALGILWLVYALWHTLTKLAGLAFLHSFLHWNSGFGFPFGGFPFGGFTIWPFLITSTLLTLALSLIAAYGVLNRQPWGRLMAIIAGVFALVHPLLGTALGIYTLWVLAPAASGVEYAAIITPRVPEANHPVASTPTATL